LHNPGAPRHSAEARLVFEFLQLIEAEMARRDESESRRCIGADVIHSREQGRF
jgi:hypothetical protein